MKLVTLFPSVEETVRLSPSSMYPMCNFSFDTEIYRDPTVAQLLYFDAYFIERRSCSR